MREFDIVSDQTQVSIIERVGFLYCVPTQGIIGSVWVAEVALLSGGGSTLFGHSGSLNL